MIPGPMSPQEEEFWMSLYKLTIDGYSPHFDRAPDAAFDRSNRAVLDFRRARQAKPESEEELRRHIL